MPSTTTKKPAAPAKGAAAGGVKKVKKNSIKNPLLVPGVRLYSNGTVMRKSCSWSFVKDPVEVAKAKLAASPAAKKYGPKTIVKKIGGKKNGDTRVVHVKKPRKFYATEDSLKPAKKSKHRTFRTARSSITPGTVLILLAGRHRGRRVVYLRQLSSGLLLVTGPFKCNACPLRRINQSFVIATSTKIDISGVKLPETLKDETFSKIKKAPVKGNTPKGGDLFQEKKQAYTVTDERKKLQADVDNQILAAVKKSPDADILLNYLKVPFYLNSRMFPHALKF